jgi:crotonobetainyl-CoA:carnitine CoA-transferase CaiB-like acyl-CoA transferase
MAGAKVIKVEPLHGDPLRIRADVDVTSLPLAMLNSNKDAVTLDLKHPRGRELLLQMVERADVVLENFAPGVLDRLGVGAEVLRARNPRLVYGSGTGYGLSGPNRDLLGMDLTIQAMGGIMESTGYPDGPPTKAGPAVSDFLSGTHLYAAIVTALYERERTGAGRTVEVAMIEAVYPMLASPIGMHVAHDGKLPPRTGNRHSGLSMAPYNTYPTTDGWVAIIVVRDEHWRNLLRAMGREDLVDEPRFATHQARVAAIAEVDELVAAWTRPQSKYAVHEALSEHKVPAAPVRGVAEVMADKHLRERGMVQMVDHPDLGMVPLPSSPLVFHGSPRTPVRPSGHLGENNHEIYCGWLGLSEAEFAALQRDRVI